MKELTKMRSKHLIAIWVVPVLAFVGCGSSGNGAAPDSGVQNPLDGSMPSVEAAVDSSEEAESAADASDAGGTKDA